MTDVRLREALGASTLGEVVEALAELLAQARSRLGYEYYMAPATLNEMRRFLVANQAPPEAVARLARFITPKPPNRHEIRLPAALIAVYVQEVRRSIMKGLRVAEEAVKRVYQETLRICREGGGEEKLRGPESPVAEAIRWLRERYREATRHGVLDSPEDLDTVLLAKELGAVLVTADEGLWRFAEELGVPVMDPLMHLEILREALREKQ